MLRMWSARLPKGCANIATQPRMSRQWRIPRDFSEISGLPGIRRVRKCCNGTKGRHGRSLTASWPGIAVRRTASLPLAYSRPSTSSVPQRFKDVDARDF